MNATELLAAVSSHYNAPNRPKGWLLAPEIAAPHSDRRADLIAAPLTHTGEPVIIGHEIKVTRADVRAELADPTKHDDWAQYCHQWWLVVADPALVAALDIPDHWGVMAPPSGRRRRSMTILRPAPVLSPKNTSDAWMKLARWQSFRADAAVRDAHNAAQGQTREIARLTRTVADLTDAGAVAANAPDLRRAAELLEKIDTRSKIEQLWDVRDLDLIADAVLDSAATRHAARDQRQLLTRIERVLSPAIASLSATLEHAVRIGNQDAPASASRN